MRTRIGLGFAALLLATAACSNSIFVSPDAGNGEDGGGFVNGGGDADAGGDAASPVDAAPPPNCDTSKLPTDDACVVNDAEGIFVSSSMGSASGNGSKASPLASLDAAIAMAKTVNRRVYACAENYAEQIHLVDGVSVFGYFDCTSGWGLGSAHAKVIAPASPAATASGITDATRVEAVDLIAPNYTTGSQSSIGLIATNSPALVIKSATVHAGTGGDGASGSGPAAPADSGSAKNGANAEAAHFCGGVICPISAGGAGGTNACTGAQNPPAPGGSGGSGGLFEFVFNSWVAQTNEPTTAGNPTTATAKNAAGGAILYAGAPGAAGDPGSDGASSSGGTFSSTGFAAGDGIGGTDGQPGQSGGGSGGAPIGSAGLGNGSQNQYGWGEGGAGGGAGGCPGLAASAGKGGGASLAIIAVQSPMTLDHVTLETSSGGAGGESGSSTAPTAGGFGGAHYQVTKDAGSGGTGGRAGISGNGAGGPSIGLAYQGTKPQMLASSTIVGAGGHGGASHLDSGTGITIPAGADGLSVTDYGF